MRLAHRLDGTPETTIFSTMSALARSTGSINLGQGFPDTEGPASVVQAAQRALADGANQYAPDRGIPVLREAIAEHQRRNYGLDLDPDTQVTFTTGCTEGIAASLLGLVNPGDEVIVLEPWYDSYSAVLQMAGAVRRSVTLPAPDFRLDAEAFRAAVTDKTRFILLNTPHNPTGTVLTPAELEVIADVARTHDLIVIADEVYEHLTFDGLRHVPIATLPGMFERTLTLSSVGKSYSFTGWKVGWATGPADLVGATLSAKQWLTFTSGSSYQPAVAHALNAESDYPRELAVSLQARRDLLCEGLAAAGLEARRSQGTYFVLTDISHLGWADSMAFCEALPSRAGVVAIPAQAFYDHPDAGRHLVRWAFCKDSDVITEGVKRLAAARLEA